MLYSAYLEDEEGLREDEKILGMTRSEVEYSIWVTPSHLVGWLIRSLKLVMHGNKQIFQGLEHNHNYKLDGVGPVDNRPSTEKLNHSVPKKNKKT